MLLRTDSRGYAVAGLIGLMVALGIQPAAVAQTTDAETFYVSMLGTRKHRLSGVNPVVGLFYTSDAGETWTHTGWEQGKAFATVRPAGGSEDTIFIAAGNGVMITKDGGVNWRITTGWEVTEVQDIGLSRLRPRDVFAATPYGVYRSRDFARTWTRVSAGFEQPFVATIRVDRTNPDVVLAGTEAGLYRSTDGGDTWQRLLLREPVRSIRQSPIEPSTWAAALQDRGVAVSTDGARTWTSSPDVDGVTIYEIEFDPSSSGRLLAGGWKTGLLESTDGGDHWRRIDQGLPGTDIHGIAISRIRDGLVMVGTMSDGVFVSIDDGVHWKPADPDIFEAGQIWDVYISGEE